MNKEQRMYIDVEAREDFIKVPGSESKFYPYNSDERLENVYVSRDGEVARKYLSKDVYYIVTQTAQRNGYLRCGFAVRQEDGSFKQVSKLVHRLVLETFVPKPDKDSKWVVDHINDKRYDNRLSNLQWLTLTSNLLKRDEAGSLYKNCFVYDRVKDTVTEYESRLAAAEAINYFVSNMVTAMKKELVIKGRYFVTDDDCLTSQDYYYIFKEVDLKNELKQLRSKKQKLVLNRLANTEREGK